MTMSDRLWTDADYDSMDWHDVAVHGFRFVEGEHGCGRLVFDIDYLGDYAA
jgi:hypothetical protein